MGRADGLGRARGARPQSALAQARPRGLIPDYYIFSNWTDNVNELWLIMRGDQATALCHIQNGCWPRLYLLGASAPMRWLSDPLASH